MELKENNITKDFEYLSYPSVEEPTWVPVPKYIRVMLGKGFIVKSKNAMLMRGRPPVYFFPREDIAASELVRSGKTEHSDKLGTAVYYNVKAGGKIAENGAWSYENPSGNAPEDISRYVALDWKAMDTWFEEDEEARVHPRDPYHRVDVIPSSRIVKVIMDGKTVAETDCPVLLFETGLPVRYYIRKTDIHMEMLEPTDLKTGCPYKGEASYYSFVNGDKMEENIAWTYPFPNPEVYRIKDFVAFYSENIEDFRVEGEKLPKIKTPWSK